MTVSSCKIDKDRDALVKKYGEAAMKQVEADYAAAVNALLSHPEQSDTLTISKVGRKGETSAKVKAGDIANLLIKSTVGFRPDQALAMGTGEFNERDKFIGNNLGNILNTPMFNFTAKMMSVDHAIMIAFVHEGMHSDKVNEQLGPRSTWYANHDTPYRQTAFRLLGIKLP